MCNFLHVLRKCNWMECVDVATIHKEKMCVLTTCVCLSPETCCCSCGVVKAVGRSPDRRPGGDLGSPALQRVQEDRMQVTGVGSLHKKLSVVEVQ